jgi:hypothetical protein
MVLIGTVATHWLGLGLDFVYSLVRGFVAPWSRYWWVMTHWWGVYFYLLSKLFDVLHWECGLACAILYCIVMEGLFGKHLTICGVANPDTDTLLNSDLDLDSGFWFPTIKKFQNWNIFLLRHPGVTSNLRTARTPSSSKHDSSIFFFVDGLLLSPGSGSNPRFQIYNSDNRPIWEWSTPLGVKKISQSQRAKVFFVCLGIHGFSHSKLGELHNNCL